MSYRKFIISCVILSGSILISGCIDEFEPETVTFESALVVEATITNEVRTHEIYLSRTFEFEADGPEAESNAQVVVEDDQGNQYSFEETSPGVYNSTTEFGAESGREYRISVSTSDGRDYSSTNSVLPSTTNIDELYAERIINDDGEEGIAIFVDSFDPTGNARNYRYTYEETYRIIAPRWYNEDFVEQPFSCDFLFAPRDPDLQVCYRTDASNSIIQFETNGLEADRVSRLLVRFINRDNYIISHRYSILVRQLVQNATSYDFYNTLNDFSGSESLFSETQVGFLPGNITSEISQEEKVLGYFEVATVQEQRIFINYDDLFPGEPLPPYINPCNETAPPLSSPAGCVLKPIVAANTVRFAGANAPVSPGEGPYLVVPRVCGDCTVLGSTEVPEFWIE